MVAILRVGATASLLLGLASQAMALSHNEKWAIARAILEERDFQSYLNERNYYDLDERDEYDLEERTYNDLENSRPRKRNGPPPAVITTRPPVPRPKTDNKHKKKPRALAMSLVTPGISINRPNFFANKNKKQTRAVVNEFEEYLFRREPRLNRAPSPHVIKRPPSPRPGTDIRHKKQARARNY